MGIRLLRVAAKFLVDEFLLFISAMGDFIHQCEKWAWERELQDARERSRERLRGKQNA